MVTNLTIQNGKDYVKIKALMILKGIKIKDIAAELKVSSAAVSRVIQGKSVSIRIRELIAKKVGMSIEELWRKK